VEVEGKKKLEIVDNFNLKFEVGEQILIFEVEYYLEVMEEEE
jgi:hypothetical protein